MGLQLPSQSLRQIAATSRRHLEAVIQFDSQSDESSSSIPSSVGQTALVDWLADFFAAHGAAIERDPHSNLIATLEGRGGAADRPPLALLVHVDTARGTQAIDELNLVPAWNGSSLGFQLNRALRVDLEHYPSLSTFVGHDVLHGPGDAPFGLDDKLGLAHLMTLAWILQTNPEIPHPTLLLIGRPDEEIGRMAAVEGIAELLVARGVRSGYTVDGIEPFEINVANFNGSCGAVWFPSRRSEPSGWPNLRIGIGGVNTHGATAKAEGHRPATRLAAELLERLSLRGEPGEGISFARFASDALRDCDAELDVSVRDGAERRRLEEALESVIGPHVARGAGWWVDRVDAPPAPDAAVVEVLRFVADFLASDPGFVLAAEDSDGWDGYSQPYRVLADADGLRLDVRFRDFDHDNLKRREAHLRRLAGERRCEVEAQYGNMAAQLADRPELAVWARRAAEAIGVEPRDLPIRGGTGVDPFLDRGVAIANLGTGYFAPESEKELTSLQLMVDHARWLVALIQTVGSR